MAKLNENSIDLILIGKNNITFIWHISNRILRKLTKLKLRKITDIVENPI